MPTVGVEFAKVSYTPAGGHLVLRDVSLALEAGTTTALLGRSGSGKTTLLRTVNALVQPTSGEVIVHGRQVSGVTDEAELIALRRGIGYVIQETGLFPHMTIETQRRTGAGDCRTHPCRGAGTCAGGSASGGSGCRGAERALSVAALRWPAAACGAGACAGSRSGRAADG
ncbi:MAG: ATP-binding cassette domain-containing protein [Edaphobacter sp.]|uniref:ATP-binding cassette domain-containing protein n=1 Tax=Edaphobacter sp. TaxID=1934404 RepID=UPI00239A315F|nr:ATP-binding cassette domain-containing protein [Edaphobacter sp.]MDE1178337.1 ATP-binding cassette domain-containing protein [Edaphobacter sp.]